MVRWLALALFVATAPTSAFAASHCIRAEVPKGAIEARNGKWIQLTTDQWQFLRGVYAMNPATPPGLPYGDHAVMAQLPGDTGALIFFIDGGLACTPMAAPMELLSMMRSVAGGEVFHETPGL